MFDGSEEARDDYLRPSPVRDSGPYLFLSLFLLLLAFFILLNAISEPRETRSRAVMSSVAATFQTETDSLASTDIFISDLGPVPTPEEILEDIERLWQTRVPVTKAKMLTPGRAMELTLPANELFIGEQAVLRADRETLFSDLAKTMKINAAGFVNELEFIVGTKVGEDGLLRLEGNTGLQRATMFAEELTAYGTPPETIGVGVVDGDPRLLRVRFYIREASRARIDFGGGKGGG